MFWRDYLEKQSIYCETLVEAPHVELHFVVVIPCYREPDLINTIESLNLCSPPDKAVEVIVVINAPAGSDAEVYKQNQITLKEIRDWKNANPFSFLKIRVLLANNLPKKDAGAGLARKIGMDEAIRRFEMIGNQDGIIISLDADTIVDPDYFSEVESFFKSHKADGCNIYFEHPLAGNESTDLLSDGIAQYELFLRYFVQALRMIQYPFAFHTIGSGFAVKADACVRQGGMNKRTAGEDFYFLQKLIPHGRFFELNTTTVYPSARVSDRVPFGTGAAMTDFMKNPGKGIQAYHLESFSEIDRLLNLIDLFYGSSASDELSLLQDECMRSFLVQNKFSAKLEEFRQNSKGLSSFRKRFFNWFNAFRVFKFLNYAHETRYKKIPVKEAAYNLLKVTGKVVGKTAGNMELLMIYRDIQKNKQWEIRL